MKTRVALSHIMSEVAFVDVDQKLGVNYHVPKRKGYLPTEIRPELYTRKRLIPGTDRMLTQHFAYTRMGSEAEILRLIKSMDSPQAIQLARRTVVYLASQLRKLYPDGFDAVMPAPSSKPLAKFMADELAVRLGNIPVLKPLNKAKSVQKTGVNQRMAAAVDNFDPGDQPNLNGRILIVDDFVTSSSTVVGVAANLLMVDDVTDVVAVGMAIH